MKSGQGPHPARWAVPTPGARLSCAPSVMMRARDTVPRVARGHGARRARRACGGHGARRVRRDADVRGLQGALPPGPSLGAACPEPWWAGPTPSARLSCAPSVMLCARDTVPRVARRHGARRARRACGGHGARRVRRDADVRGLQGALPPGPSLGAACPEPWWAGPTPSARLSCAPSVMLCARDTVPRVARRHGARRARRACGGHGAQRVRRDADVRGQGALPPRTPLAIFGDLWCWLHVCRSLYIREGMLHLAIPAAWPEQPPSASAGGRHLSQLRRRAHKKILPQRGRCHGESRDG